jgi:hypothetical protein
VLRSEVVRQTDGTRNTEYVRPRNAFPFGCRRPFSYLFRMDWQEATALVIVALTAVLFLRARLRRRKGKLPCDAHCGCGNTANPPKETVVYHARKGERPEIIVKLR